MMFHRRSETVTLWDRVASGEDSLGNEVYARLPIEVPGVLVAIGSQKDADESMRPEGASVAYTLYFPSGSVDVSGTSEIDVRGRRCKVVGIPDRWNCPEKDYDMVVEVSYGEG